MSIQSAIQSRRLLSFTYEGFSRIAEPHTYGVDGKGHYAVRAYQISGGSHSNESEGWKLFHVNQITGLAILPSTFSGPRRGYKRGDRAFRSILAQL